MPSIFSLIGSSWNFYRKQPALNQVLLWLMILPMTALNIFTRLISSTDFPLTETDLRTVWPYQGMIDITPGLLPIIILIFIALTLVITWGTACILLIGKRMIQSKAGRSRTSFKAVRKDAGAFVLPLFLTDILRDIFAVFWSFLLIVPGIIYFTRTIFYHVIIVTEKKQYRDALRCSKEIVYGHTWTVFWYMLGLALLIFLPTSLLTGMIENVVASLDPQLYPASDLLTSTLVSFATLLLTLSTILLYGEVKKLSFQ